MLFSCREKNKSTCTCTCVVGIDLSVDLSDASSYFSASIGERSPLLKGGVLRYSGSKPIQILHESGATLKGTWRERIIRLHSLTFYM